MPRYESPYDPSTMPRKLEHVIYEKKGHVAYVTLNRPEVRNALNAALISELEQVLVSLEADPAARVIVLAGAGDRAFRTLYNGRTLHGIEFLSPARTRLPTAYYGPESGVGRLLNAGRLVPLSL